MWTMAGKITTDGSSDPARSAPPPLGSVSSIGTRIAWHTTATAAKDTPMSLERSRRRLPSRTSSTTLAAAYDATIAEA